MAIQTGTSYDVPGVGGTRTTVTYSYDDVSLLLTAVDVVNNGLYPLPVQATVTSNGRTFAHTTPPGQTFHQNVPTGAAQRLELFVNSKGWLDGIDWNIG